MGLKKIRSMITFADTVTSLNLIAGVLAIQSAIVGDTRAAIILIGAGMLFDFFDGRIARYYNEAHEFGAELDSLADMGSFGIAPGIVMLVLYNQDMFVLTAAAIYAVTAAMRLARYNLKAKKKPRKAVKFFEGVPTPFAAFIILALSFIGLPGWGMALVILIVATLMVSKVPIPKL